MDNLCHTLVGIACSEAGLKRQSRLAATTLAVAANLPDVDVLAFFSSSPAVAIRRGWTHGVLAQVTLPILFAGLMFLIARRRPSAPGGPPASASGLLLLSYVGVLSHVALDFLNTYGVRLLMPFESRWFYGDAVFIIDPSLWFVLGAGVWLARRRGSATPARGALAFAAAYVMVMLLAADASRLIVSSAWESVRGQSPRALMVGPIPITPFERSVIVDAGDHYETGTLSWLPTRVTFDPIVVPKNDQAPAVAAARKDPTVRGFLIWSRFPYWTIQPEPGGMRVTVRDMRFGGPLRGRFAASAVVK
jgi:inner membrane protein